MTPKRHLTTMKAGKTKDSTDMGKVAGAAGNLESMTIRPAENGFTAEHRFSSQKGDRGGMGSDMQYQEPEHHVFANHHQLAKHVKDTFGGNQAEEAAEGEQA